MLLVLVFFHGDDLLLGGKSSPSFVSIMTTMEIENHSVHFCKMCRTAIFIFVVMALTWFCVNEYRRRVQIEAVQTYQVSSSEADFIAYGIKLDGLAVKRSQRLLAKGDTAAALEEWRKYNNQ